MTQRLVVVAAAAVIVLVGFFFFPGHTYLLADTQIYLPMMERIWNPGALSGDLVATKPHLAFTIYDEASAAVRGLAHGSFEEALTAQQLLFRFFEILGVYLLASALPLSRWRAFTVAACAGLGAIVLGPSVLFIEYEPVPRGFAIGLLFLAIGLVARGRPVWASTAASVAFLYHAPTTIPFWVCFVPWLVWRRKWWAFAPLAAAMAGIGAAAHWQSGVVEHQQFFFRLDPELERLQKLRAEYNWVANWVGQLWWQYLLWWGASMLAYWRVRPRAGRVFLIGLPVIGLLSVPVSYLLLDRLKWGLMSQVQPARALLFVTAIAMILGAAAGLKASTRWEAAAWFGFVLFIPMRSWMSAWPDVRQCALAGALALAMAVLARWEKIAILVPLSAMLLIPTVGRVRNYGHPETPDLVELERFARESTPPNAVFLFADAGHSLEPGIFRARALRPVYVDWKAGGQVNYYRSVADEWWSKWERAGELKGGEDVASLGVDYVVWKKPRVAGDPVFRNGSYAVFKARAADPARLP
jgi:hypothetical protein